MANRSYASFEEWWIETGDYFGSRELEIALAAWDAGAASRRWEIEDIHRLYLKAFEELQAARKETERLGQALLAHKDRVLEVLNERSSGGIRPPRRSVLSLAPTRTNKRQD